MTALEISHFRECEIHPAVFAPLYEQGWPQTCGIDRMLVFAEILKRNLSMAKSYPIEKCRENLEVFRIFQREESFNFLPLQPSWQSFSDRYSTGCGNCICVCHTEAEENIS